MGAKQKFEATGPNVSFPPIADIPRLTVSGPRQPIIARPRMSVFDPKRFVITLVGALLHDSMSGAPNNSVALYVLRLLYFGVILVAGLARGRSVVVVVLTSLSLLYLGVGLAETIGIAV